MSSLSEVESEYALYKEQLDVVDTQLKNDPENAELKSLKTELNEMIDLLKESLAELKQKEQDSKDSAAKSSGFSKVSGPASASGTAADEIPAYHVNDMVSARWTSGDRQWYTARITGITGSSTAPMYTVKFKSYDTIETVRARDIRPLHNNKRKAEDDPVTSTSTPTSITPAAVVSPASTFSPLPSSMAGSSSAGTVVSAAASIYPDQVAKMKAQQEAKDGEKPRKAKKIKANKELEAGKTKWQEFASKSKFAKSHKKESMFRTPDGASGRVGFIGSGKAMRKDTARTRHIYQQVDED